MSKLFAAAGAVIDGAIAVLTFAKRFVEKNTPESALLAALFTIYQTWSNGQIPSGAAAISAITALMTFAITESTKDAAQVKAAAMAPAPQADQTGL